ncbi:TIGR02301 family protein [Pelagibacterium montanilacus]|uniref:TIGR02301 family protein n=1 Tax=Pelagibacterium montanilacus TaxID=2185280 RepID=UPI001FE3E958|nr:TIGR02301 family protein [Pelagibacterium montanilacus]
MSPQTGRTHTWKAHWLARMAGAVLLVVALGLPHGARAVDPPYQPQMERLAEILGSLYMLSPLCRQTEVDWRGQMADLLALDAPDPDRRARIAGAFNQGYEAYARLYRSCTPSARTAIALLLREGEALSRDIHTRFSE